MLRRNTISMRVISTPSRVMVPVSGSYRRSKRDITVDLPQPDGPIMHVSFLAGMVRFRPFKMVWLGLEGYKNVT